MRGRPCDRHRAPLADQSPDVVLSQRVEPAGGLVEDQDLRIVHERGDHADLLPVALREVWMARSRLSAEPLGQWVDRIVTVAPCRESPQCSSSERRSAAARQPDRPGR